MRPARPVVDQAAWPWPSPAQALRADFARFGGGPTRTATENAAAYASVAAYYAGQEVVVGLGADEYQFDPIDPADGIKLAGAGYGTVLRFPGDVTPLLFDGTSRSGLSHVRLVVDTDNANDVIRLDGGSQNEFDHLWIDTPDGNAPPSASTQGTFTGLRLYGTGCWNNRFGHITVNNCARGAVVESPSDGWVTLNRFDHLLVRTFSDVAVELDEDPNGIVTNNTFTALSILDWIADDTTRTGLRLSGAGNAFPGLQIINDGGNGTFYALDLRDDGVRSYGNTISGAIEGLIREPDNARNHTIHVHHAKRANFSETPQIRQVRSDDRIEIPTGGLAAGIGDPEQTDLGTFYKGWLLDTTSTKGVTASFVARPGWKAVKVTVWVVHVGGSGDASMRLVSSLPRTEGASVASATGGTSVTVPARTAGQISKVVLHESLAVTEGRITFLAPERLGPSGGMALAPFQVDVEPAL